MIVSWRRTAFGLLYLWAAAEEADARLSLFGENCDFCLLLVLVADLFSPFAIWLRGVIIFACGFLGESVTEIVDSATLVMVTGTAFDWARLLKVNCFSGDRSAWSLLPGDDEVCMSRELEDSADAIMATFCSNYC